MVSLQDRRTATRFIVFDYNFSSLCVFLPILFPAIWYEKFNLPYPRYQYLGYLGSTKVYIKNMIPIQLNSELSLIFIGNYLSSRQFRTIFFTFSLENMINLTGLYKLIVMNNPAKYIYIYIVMNNFVTYISILPYTYCRCRRQPTDQNLSQGKLTA